MLAGLSSNSPRHSDLDQEGAERSGYTKQDGGNNSDSGDFERPVRDGQHHPDSGAEENPLFPKAWVLGVALS